MFEGYNEVRELINDYETTTVNGIIAWLVQTEVATEEQLAPLRDGSYKADLPADTFRSKPKPLPTGLDDGSTWPIGLSLPRADHPYYELFNIRVSKLDRLIKADKQPKDFETVAQLRARKDKALNGEYPPSLEQLREAMTAISAARDRIMDAIEAQGGDWLEDERVEFLMTLGHRVGVLLNTWEEDELRDRLTRMENLVADYPNDRPLVFKRLLQLYRIASLTRDGHWLRGYKAGLSKNRYYDREGGVEVMLAKAVHNTQAVLVQMREPQDRRDYLAGLEQGVRDGQVPEVTD